MTGECGLVMPWTTDDPMMMKYPEAYLACGLRQYAQHILPDLPGVGRAVLAVLGVWEAYLARSEEGRPSGPWHGGGVPSLSVRGCT